MFDLKLYVFIEVYWLSKRFFPNIELIYYYINLAKAHEPLRTHTPFLSSPTQLL
jgi:hypothetical protein